MKPIDGNKTAALMTICEQLILMSPTDDSYQKQYDDILEMVKVVKNGYVEYINKNNAAARSEKIHSLSIRLLHHVNDKLGQNDSFIPLLLANEMIGLWSEAKCSPDHALSKYDYSEIWDIVDPKEAETRRNMENVASGAIKYLRKIG